MRRKILVMRARLTFPLAACLRWALLILGLAATFAVYLHTHDLVERDEAARLAQRAHELVLRAAGRTAHASATVDAVVADALRTANAHVDRQRWLPWLVAAIGLAASLATFFLIGALNRARQQSDVAHRAAGKALRLRERAIEASANAILITSARGPDYAVEYVNPAFERMTGYAAADIIGRGLQVLHGDDRDQPGLEEIRAIVRERRAGHATLRNYRKGGGMFWSHVRIAPVPDEHGEVTHFVAAKYDVTDTVRYQEQLEHQANHDSLTGLPNRALLMDRIGHGIAQAARADRALWVVFIDLDRFKLINDTLGHSEGDELLKAVAERFRGALRDSDTVARYGGDEFVLVLAEREGEACGTRAVQRVIDTLAQPIVIGDNRFVVTASAGIAAYPADGTDADTLIKHADIAMYRAKQQGRNRFQFFAADMNDSVLERLRLETDLRGAIERGEFELCYQPQVYTENSALAGMEALIRWRHPMRGLVSPATFIPVAEECGLIVPIGEWVLRAACSQIAAWESRGLDPVRVAVNVSARQFAEPEFAATVAGILQQTGVAPRLLEVEVTEGAMMDDVMRAVGVLRELKALGVQISIDDFGTGYSSLAYLKRFPIDMLKIDQSFVRDIAIDPDDAAIVQAIISLAHSLRLKVIAEGVEDTTQRDYLMRHGCEQIQGYLIAQPLAVAEAEQFLAARRLPARAA